MCQHSRADGTDEEFGRIAARSCYIFLAAGNAPVLLYVYHERLAQTIGELTERLEVVQKVLDGISQKELQARARKTKANQEKERSRVLDRKRNPPVFGRSLGRT